MNTIKLKKIALFLGFSPNTENLLLETKRLCIEYKSNLYIFHVGKNDIKTSSYFENIFSKLGMTNMINFEIIESLNVEKSIIKSCKKNKIDLLVIGALKEESFVKKYFLGSISRNVIKKIKSSVLLFVEPISNRKKFNNIATFIEKNNTTSTENNILKTSINILKKENSSKLNIFKQTSNSILETAVYSSEKSEEEEKKIEEKKFIEEKKYLQNLLEKMDVPSKKTDINVSLESGYSDLKKYLLAKKSDLLIINSDERKKNFFETFFSKKTEYILEDIPCNLLILHNNNGNI